MAKQRSKDTRPQPDLAYLASIQVRSSGAAPVVLSHKPDKAQTERELREVFKIPPGPDPYATRSVDS